jgi:multiple sugar transport system substrate-binding protein
MQELYGRVDPRFFRCNPITVAELMTATDDYWYCPFAYGYSNYSRTGYARNLLQYGDLVRFGESRLRSTIGGTGLSVSAYSQHKAEALRFTEWVVSGRIQSTLYMEHGGQPGYGGAWTDANANRLCHNYFASVLPTMERGYTRPRYNGYLFFQDQAGGPIRDYLMGEGTAGAVLKQINEIYKQSLTLEKVIV